MSASSLKERPIGPQDFVDDSAKRWAWGLAPLIVGIATMIANSLFGYRWLRYEYPIEASWTFILYQFDSVLYLSLAILALWACRAYRGSGDAGAKSPITTVGISLALIISVVAIDGIPHLIYTLGQGRSLAWTFFDYDFDGRLLLQSLQLIFYVVFQEAALRGVVIGSLLRDSATQRSAILTATFFDVLAATPFIFVFDLARIFSGFSTSSATDMAVAIVMPIVTGLGLGALRIASGRLWPCVVVGVLAASARYYL